MGSHNKRTYQWDGVAIGKPGQKAPIAANPVTKNTTSSKLAEKAQAAKPKVTNTSAQDQAKQPARQGALNFNALTKPKTAAHVSSEDQADDSKGKKPVSNILFGWRMLMLQCP